jgi:tetraacyldisaccharide 4'-kinase
VSALRPGSRRPWAWPLVPLYAGGLAAKNVLRAAGVLSTRKLQWPVISVGSLSAGGAGKTPVVIALAELLKARGWHVDVLTRGYGRDSSDERLKDFAAQVVPDLDDAAARFGDEPTLIARRTCVPVWVGANRFFAGQTAEDFATEETWDFVSEAVVDIKPAAPVRGVHLLDDGFQHRQLARTVDIVLVTEEDLRDSLFPAGNLREPLSSLRLADIVVLRETERAQIETRVRALMRPEALLWTIRRELLLSNEINPGPRPLAFCAIARPDSFSTMLAQAGCQLVDEVAFPDHHTYEMVDMDRLVSLATNRHATGFLTTEKDAVKLYGPMLQRLQSIGPVCVVALEAKFTDEAEVMRELEARCR